MANQHKIEVAKTDGTKSSHIISDEQLRVLQAASYATGTVASTLGIREILIKNAKYVEKIAEKIR